MATNYLEALISEWYEFQGYLVRRNIRVGKLARGGYEGELDVVAFNPATNHLVHVEPSMDAMSWAQREKAFRKKFEVAKKHVSPAIFNGLKLPNSIDHVAFLGFAGRKHPKTLGDGRVLVIPELLEKICTAVKPKSAQDNAIPEQFPILRTIQLLLDWSEDVLPRISSET